MFLVDTRQGITLTWDILAIMAVYFVQGALGLARLATTFFFKDELHLAPAEVAALSGLFTLPWVFKPLYGFLSDGLPIFGYRRYIQLRSLLVSTGQGCALPLKSAALVYISPRRIADDCRPVGKPTVTSFALIVISASSEIRRYIP